MEAQIAQLLRRGSKAHNRSAKLDQRKMQVRDLMVGLQKCEMLGRLERAAIDNNFFLGGGVPALPLQLVPSS